MTSRVRKPSTDWERREKSWLHWILNHSTCESQKPLKHSERQNALALDLCTKFQWKTPWWQAVNGVLRHWPQCDTHLSHWPQCDTHATCGMWQMTDGSNDWREDSTEEMLTLPIPWHELEKSKESDDACHLMKCRCVIWWSAGWEGERPWQSCSSNAHSMCPQDFHDQVGS